MFYIYYAIMKNFDTGDAILSERLWFCEKQLSEIHTLVEGTDVFVSGLLIFIFNLGTICEFRESRDNEGVVPYEGKWN
jgi:hypothetical protein